MITSSAKKSVGPTSRVASVTTSQWRPSALVPGEMVVRVLHHHDAGVDHGPDGDGDAAEGHDVDVQPLHGHRDECREDTEG